MGDGVTVVRVTAGRVAADRHPIGQIQLIRIVQPTSTYLIDAGFRFRHGIQRSGFRAAGIPGQDRKFFILQNTVVQLRDFPLYTFCDGSQIILFPATRQYRQCHNHHKKHRKHSIHKLYAFLFLPVLFRFAAALQSVCSYTLGSKTWPQYSSVSSSAVRSIR